MKQPTDIHAALARIHTLLGAIAEDLTRYMDDTDMQYDPEYFEDVTAAALDACASAHAISPGAIHCCHLSRYRPAAWKRRGST